MNCSRCHHEVSEAVNYCPMCGERQSGVNRRGGRLTRSAADSKIAGVCGGIAEYLGTDATLVRLAWAVLAIVPGCLVGGLAAYIVAWIIMPKAERAAPAAAHSATV